SLPPILCYLLSLNGPATSYLHPLSLHDALPIFTIIIVFGLVIFSQRSLMGITLLGMSEDAEAATLRGVNVRRFAFFSFVFAGGRSEEHTSELQSRFDLVCRLLLEKKNRHRVRRP